jgi:hypothetical protein
MMADKQAYITAAESILGRKKSGPSKGRKFADVALAFMQKLKETKTLQAKEQADTKLHNLNNSFADEEGRLKVISDRAVAAVKRLQRAQNHDTGYDGFFREKAQARLTSIYPNIKQTSLFDPENFIKMETSMAEQMRKQFEAKYMADTGLKSIEDTPPTEKDLYGIYTQDLANIKREIMHPSRLAAFPKLKKLVGYSTNEDYDIAYNTSQAEIGQKKLIKRFDDSQKKYVEWYSKPENRWQDNLTDNIFTDPVKAAKWDVAGLQQQFTSEVLEGIINHPNNKDKKPREILSNLSPYHKLLYSMHVGTEDFKNLPAIPGFESDEELKALARGQLMAGIKRTKGNTYALTQLEKAMAQTLPNMEKLGIIDYAYTKTEFDTTKRGILSGTAYNQVELFFETKNSDDYPTYKLYTDAYNGLDRNDKAAFIHAVVFHSKYLQAMNPDLSSVQAMDKALERQKFGLRQSGEREYGGVMGTEEVFDSQEFFDVDDNLQINRGTGEFGINNVLAILNGEERYQYDVSLPIAGKPKDAYTRAWRTEPNLPDKSVYSFRHTTVQTGIMIGYNKDTGIWEEIVE